MIIFAYGSIQWAPDFTVRRRLPALLPGRRRAWCIDSVHHRGTADRPGVVLGLLGGGNCVGEILEIDDRAANSTMAVLGEREGRERGYRSEVVDVHTPFGEVRAMCFSTPEALDMDETTVMRRILDSRGRSGSNREYAERTSAHLEATRAPAGWPKAQDELPDRVRSALASRTAPRCMPTTCKSS